MEFSILFQEHLLPALVFTIIITILVVTILVKGIKEQQRRPPEPAGAIPLLGHLHRLGKNKLLHITLADMANKYGPAFSIRTCGPYGQYWRIMRKIVTVELLSSRRLELLEHVPDTETNRHCGAKGSCNEESRRFQKALGDFMYLIGVFLVSDAVPFRGWLDVVMGNVGKMKRAAKELDFVLGSWVNEHRERRHNEDSKGEKDFIDVMLSIMDESNVPSQEADVTIKATCLTLVLGGADTTMVTLTWALSLLLNNRHVLKKAQDELDTHVGKQRQVDESDIT
ncbi:hypothetical protein V6N12_048264 [Hibiscus sabdariffa]